MSCGKLRNRNLSRAAKFADKDRRCLDEESGRAESSASAGHVIMYLGTKEAKRPKGPAKLREILEKREAVLSKWRDGTISPRDIFRTRIIIFFPYYVFHMQDDKTRLGRLKRSRIKKELRD